MGKIFYSFFTCLRANRSFLSYKCFFFRKKTEIYWSGGTPPPVLVKDQYISFFFLLKASLSQNVCVYVYCVCIYVGLFLCLLGWPQPLLGFLGPLLERKVLTQLKLNFNIAYYRWSIDEYSVYKAK